MFNSKLQQAQEAKVIIELKNSVLVQTFKNLFNTFLVWAAIWPLLYIVIPDFIGESTMKLIQFNSSKIFYIAFAFAVLAALPHLYPPLKALRNVFVALCKTSPQFTTMITGCLPPVALSCNHQLQQSSN